MSQILFVARVKFSEERLELKIDPQFILIENVMKILVNGVVGRVLGFRTSAGETPPSLSFFSAGLYPHPVAKVEQVSNVPQKPRKIALSC